MLCSNVYFCFCLDNIHLFPNPTLIPDLFKRFKSLPTNPKLSKAFNRYCEVIKRNISVLIFHVEREAVKFFIANTFRIFTLCMFNCLRNIADIFILKMANRNWPV
jgi:hypothetical protein